MSPGAIPGRRAPAQAPGNCRRRADAAVFRRETAAPAPCRQGRSVPPHPVRIRIVSVRARSPMVARRQPSVAQDRSAFGCRREAPSSAGLKLLNEGQKVSFNRNRQTGAFFRREDSGALNGIAARRPRMNWRRRELERPSGTVSGALRPFTIAGAVLFAAAKSAMLARNVRLLFHLFPRVRSPASARQPCASPTRLQSRPLDRDGARCRTRNPPLSSSCRNWACRPTAIDDLLHQNALLDAVGELHQGFGRRHGELLPSLSPARPALAWAALQLRHRHPSRPIARRRAEDLPAELSRILRAPAFRFGAFVTGGTSSSPDHEAAFRTDLLFSRQRSSRGTLGVEICETSEGADPTLDPRAAWRARPSSPTYRLECARREISHRDMLCQAHSARVASSPISIRRPAPQNPRPTSPGTGRPRSTRTGETRRSRALRGRAATRLRRRRSGPHGRRTHADDDLQRLRADLEGVGHFRTVAFELGAPSGSRTRPDAQRFPYVPTTTPPSGTLLQSNIQARPAAQRLEEPTKTDRHRRVGRPGIRHRPARRLYGLRPVEAAARKYSRLHAAGLRDVLDHQRQRLAADEGAGRFGSRDRHDAGLPADAGRSRPSGRTRRTGLHDATYENVQAGFRTSLLRLANQNGAIVLGTGDLSELALGWCTYGVGDQMARYNVNASVPKTLIQHLIRWCAADRRFGADAAPCWRTFWRPRFRRNSCPAHKGRCPAQLTEDFVGPYALQDFNLYYITRPGSAAVQSNLPVVERLARCGGGDGRPNIRRTKKVAYDLPIIKNGSACFSRGSSRPASSEAFGAAQRTQGLLGRIASPRGDWRAPSIRRPPPGSPTSTTIDRPWCTSSMAASLSGRLE